MTHVSKKKLPSDTEKFLNEMLLDILTGLSSTQASKVIDVLITDTEQSMLKKRLGVLLLLENELTDKEISKKLGITRQTVRRLKLELYETSIDSYDFVRRNIVNFSKKTAFKRLAASLLETNISRNKFRKEISKYITGTIHTDSD